MRNVFAAVATVLIAGTTAIVVFTLVKTPIDIKPPSIYVALCHNGSANTLLALDVGGLCIA